MGFKIPYGTGFVNYKKGCTRLAAGSDQVYQMFRFSLVTPASSTTKNGHHDIAEILLKVALNTKNQSNQTIGNRRENDPKNVVQLMLINSCTATSVTFLYNYTLKPNFLYVFLENFKLQITPYELVGGFYHFENENKNVIIVIYWFVALFVSMNNF